MITLYFGSPGCGKTTVLAKLAKKACKARFFGLFRKYKHVVSNVFLDLPNANIDDFRDLGNTYVFPQRTLILVDEASIEYNNRLYKSLPQYKIEYFKLHRHYRHDLVLFSQSWEDVDVTLRRLCDQLWHVRKLGPFSIMRKVHKFVDMDENTHQLVDGYEFEPLWKLLFLQPVLKFIFRPRYYKYFDSYVTKDNLRIRSLS